jgi:CHAT domain-containing protein
VSQQLAQLTLAATGPKQRESRRRRLKQLNAQKQAIESELAKISIEFRRQTEIEEASVQDLAALLDKHAAVIDIINPAQWDPPQKGKPLRAQKHYEAFVLRPTDEAPGYTVVWVHLGLEEPINQAITAWRATLTGEGPVPSRPETRPEQLLREAIWEKIEPHLAGCSKIVVIPDGDLHFLPWGALPGRAPGTYLIKDYAISVAPYGQQLYAALTDSHSPGQGTLLVGGVAYDKQPAPVKPEPLAAASITRSRAPALSERMAWRDLPGSAAEVQAIAALGKSTGYAPSMLTGTEASEWRLREALPGRQSIHLATHGFFADEKFRSWAGHDLEGEQLIAPGSGLVSAGRSRVTGYNPMILSGIVLAGANLPPKTDELGLPTGEDGILTAEEIVGLDLRGTELVVLSACDTGLGRVAGGEGVLGLTRAFHMAGARNVIASLWKVDDQATTALMKLFYHKLWKENEPPIEALREAQLAIYHNPHLIGNLAGSRGPDFEKTVKLTGGGQRQPSSKTAPPKLWAAFVLSGPGN